MAEVRLDFATEKVYLERRPPPPNAMPDTHSQDPMHGVTLEMILVHLVERFGWERLGNAVPIRCFQFDPSIPSSLKFLRRTPWARARVEELYRRDVLRNPPGTPGQTPIR